MATLAPSSSQQKSITPDLFGRFLAGGAGLLLLAVLAALFRGQNEWHLIGLNLGAHLGTMIVALGLTPIVLLRRRGDRAHRILGTVWLLSMMTTALVTFTIRGSNQGSFSFIHILSVWTGIQVPLIWWSARNHQIVRHRSAVRGMVFGALLIAGFFTFPFDRLLGHWLFA
jgi:uncharacterized membrane protein